MAFFSLMLVGVVIALIILGIFAVIGLVLLVAGIVCKKKDKNKGRKFPVVLIAIGSVFLGIPVMLGLVMLVSGAFGEISKGIEGTTYESVTDEWRNGGYIGDATAKKQAINALCEFSESGDKESFSELFTRNIQAEQGFQEEIDAYFESYPKGLGLCELDGGLGSSSGSTDDGLRTSTVSTYYTCMLDGEWYFISLCFCYENDKSPEDIGVTDFHILNLEAYAMDRDYDENEHLSCTIESEDNVTARLIDDRAFRFTPTPDRKITADELKRYLVGHKDIGEIRKKYGEPNVYKKYSNCTGHDFYYELVPENEGEPLYAYICAGGQHNGEIYSVYLCTDKETLYGREMYRRAEK